MLRIMLAATFASLCLAASATAETQVALAPSDYAKADAWLCRPDQPADACRQQIDVTVIAPDGGTSVVRLSPDPKAPVDCFYVYPTISRDPEILSDMTPGPEEAGVAAIQAAPFAGLCRIFAPMYRQMTVTSLRLVARGAPRPSQSFEDVRAAWRRYLAHDNGGRGVILIGHSQGSRHLARLLAEEIEGKPATRLLISALVIGYNLPVTRGQDLGFLKSTPLCRTAGQTGCVIAYVSFEDKVPPAPTARFGRPETPSPGMETACVNPAALAGHDGLRPLMTTAGIFAGPAKDFRWGTNGPEPRTPFVALPGWIAARCAEVDGAHVLQVRLDRPEGDLRPATIPGHLVSPDGALNADWGLHMVDMNLALGDLLEVVRRQRDAWLAQKKTPAS